MMNSSNLLINISNNKSYYLNKSEPHYSSHVIYVNCYRQDVAIYASMLKLNGLTRASVAVDLTVSDFINYKTRFNIIYILQSVTTSTRFIISTWASETSPIYSLQNIYRAFNWAEREVWDMFGLFVINHPDLRRILTDYGFIGNPLRKDFPLTGFKEVQYDDTIKNTEYSLTELSQAYRLFTFKSSWHNF